MKPSELLPSVHAYLSTRYPKAAKALQKAGSPRLAGAMRLRVRDYCAVISCLC